jgi:Zn-dependent peptidase ImmA (M78 family)
MSRLHNGSLDEQAEDLARELRGYIGIGNSPIPDVLALIESELRIRLFLVPIPATISGAYTWHEALGACILINSNHAKTRQNWTAAHELGHFMTNRDSVEVLAESPINHSREDRFANLFAEAFLMPGNAVRRRYWDIFEADGKFSTRSLMYLAATFHVSTKAMGLRLEKLGLVSKGTTEMLEARGVLQSLAKTALGTQDRETCDMSSLPRYTMIALEAYEKELISEGELAKMLRIGRIEVRELIDSLEICEAHTEDSISA